MWWQVRNYQFERDFNLHFSQKHDEFQCDIRKHKLLGPTSDTIVLLQEYTTVEGLSSDGILSFLDLNAFTNSEELKIFGDLIDSKIGIACSTSSNMIFLSTSSLVVPLLLFVGVFLCLNFFCRKVLCCHFFSLCRIWSVIDALFSGARSFSVYSLSGSCKQSFACCCSNFFLTSLFLKSFLTNLHVGIRVKISQSKCFKKCCFFQRRRDLTNIFQLVCNETTFGASKAKLELSAARPWFQTNSIPLQTFLSTLPVPFQTCSYSFDRHEIRIQTTLNSSC